MLTVKIKFYHLILLFVTFGCNQEDSTENDMENNNCESEIVNETIRNVRGKVVKVNDVYSITTDVESLEESGYIIGSMNILVPYNLEEKYRNEELQVIVSGYNKGCCELLSLPQLRSEFGCQFEITSIEIFNK